MKIIEILNETKKIRPECALDNTEGLRLINELDKKIYDGIISTHEMEDVTYKHESVNEEAIVPDEHIGLYILYIFTHFDLIRAETKRYQNDMTAYNLAYSNYYDYINRTYMPKKKAQVHW